MPWPKGFKLDDFIGPLFIYFPLCEFCIVTKLHDYNFAVYNKEWGSNTIGRVWEQYMSKGGGEWPDSRKALWPMPLEIEKKELVQWDVERTNVIF